MKFVNSDNFHLDNMEYPSLSLEQDLIDRIFSGEKNPKQEDLKKIPLSQSIRMKEYDRKKKKILLENPVVEECDQCTIG